MHAGAVWDSSNGGPLSLALLAAAAAAAAEVILFPHVDITRWFFSQEAAAVARGTALPTAEKRTYWL